MELQDFLVPQYRSNFLFHRQLLDQVTSDLTDDELNWQAMPGHHSVWHHVWHMWLSNDYYFADAFLVPAVWDEGNWAKRLDLSSMARVFDYPGKADGAAVPRFVISDVPDSLVDELKAASLAGYMEYVDHLLERTTQLLSLMTEEQLKRRVDWYGGAPIPAHVAGLGFSHVARHIGMIEDLRGLIRGPGQGTASI